MDKLKTHFSLCVKSICTILLSFLGFESSSEMRVMYGMPVGNFEIKGAVSVADSNEAVKDAQIKAKYDNEANQTVISIARTDSTGNFILSGKAVSDRLQIICTPIDTILRPDTIKVDLTYRRNDSTPEISINDIGKLKKKQHSQPIQKTPNGYRGSAQKNINFILNRKK